MGRLFSPNTQNPLKTDQHPPSCVFRGLYAHGPRECRWDRYVALNLQNEE